MTDIAVNRSNDEDDDGACITLTEHTVIHAAWFVGGDGVDWMAMVYRDTADAPWKMRYRFRYHAPGSGSEPHPDDRFSAFEVIAKGENALTDLDRDRLAHGVILISMKVAKEFKSTVNHVVVNGSTADFDRLWSKQSFVSVRVMPPCPERVQ